MPTAAPPRAGAALAAPSPPATRLRRPRWYDARLLAGVALVVVSAVAGASLVRAADRTVTVWAPRHDLAAGLELRADDLVPRPARLFGADAGRYLDARTPPPPGARLTRPVGAGELLPVAAITTTATSPRRVVAIPLTRAHALGGQVTRGMTVDVVATHQEAGRRTTTRAVLRNAPVVDVVRQPSGFVAATGDLVLLVEVDPAAALAVTAAIETAKLDVLAVIPGSGGPGDLGADPVVSGEPR